VKNIPVPIAACAKGGRSRGMAKQNAVARAQAAALAVGGGEDRMQFGRLIMTRVFSLKSG